MMSSALALVSMVSCLTTLSAGLSAVSFSAAESILLRPTSFGGVDDLALQVAGVDDVEVDEAEGADAGGGEVEGERRAESAGAHAEDFGGFELLLALHAHFGQDEVARVAREFVVGKLGQGDGFGGGGHESSLRMRLRDRAVQVLTAIVFARSAPALPAMPRCCDEPAEIPAPKARPPGRPVPRRRWRG